MKMAMIYTAAAVLVGSVLFITPSEAGTWSLLKGSQLDDHVTDESYNLPVAGIDLRVYEWTPKGNPNVTCVAAFGTDNPVGMQCFYNPPTLPNHN